MNKYALVLIVAALIVTAWLAWLKPAGETGADDEAEPATEVAVRVGSVTQATLRAYVTAYGVVEPEPAGDGPAASASVAPFVPGVVTAVNCVEGQRVARDDVLFVLDSLAADVAVEFAEKNVARQERLLAIEGTSERLLQDAEQQLDAALVQQALLRVRSPLAGTVTRVNVKLGEAVDLMTAMAEVVDLDRLVVSANVPSEELRAIDLGQEARVSVGGSASPVAGSVSYISPRVDPQTGTAIVRVKVSNASELRPGQFATLRIVTAEHVDRLAVPEESVVNDEDGMSVIAIVEGETAVRKPVQTGLRDQGLVEVAAEGLQAGMTVVTEGAYGLPEETRVRVLGE